ncbi:STAS domain-containing protein [Streptomyces sp. NPDC127159]
MPVGRAGITGVCREPGSGRIRKAGSRTGVVSGSPAPAGARRISIASLVVGPCAVGAVASSWTHRTGCRPTVRGYPVSVAAGPSADLGAATDRSTPDVLVALRPVDSFDRSGLRVLCRAETRAGEHGGRHRLVSETPRMHQVLRAGGPLTRLWPPAECAGPRRRRR